MEEYWNDSGCVGRDVFGETKYISLYSIKRRDCKALEWHKSSCQEEQSSFICGVYITILKISLPTNTNIWFNHSANFVDSHQYSSCPTNTEHMECIEKALQKAVRGLLTAKWWTVISPNICSVEDIGMRIRLFNPLRTKFFFSSFFGT